MAGAKAVIVADPSGNPLPYVEPTLVIGQKTEVLPLTNADGYSLSHFNWDAGSGYLKVVANGFKSYIQTLSLDGNNQDIFVGKQSDEPNAIILPPLSFSKPSRDRICHVMANLCNLRDAEDIPIFEPFINSLIVDKSPKVQDWVARLKGAGSTHISTYVTGDYNEFLPWANGRYPIRGLDCTKDIGSLKRILDYLLSVDLIPILKSGCDGQGFDPNGWTYGWSWGMQNMPAIYDQLNEYKNSILWSTGFDGCFADWSPDQLLQFLRMMRSSLGTDACIDTETNGPGSISYCHLGQGAANWANDQLGDLDNFSLELEVYPPQDDGLAQTATRLLGPAALNAPTTPYYLQNTTKKTNICIYETVAYWAIRKYISVQDAVNVANQCARFGYTSFGNGLPS